MTVPSMSWQCPNLLKSSEEGKGGDGRKELEGFLLKDVTCAMDILNKEVLKSSWKSPFSESGSSMTTPALSKSYHGTESEAESVQEEEKIQYLFQACDGDGDGYIDSQDLEIVCRELHLEELVEELQRELGADEYGRISFRDFLRCRFALRHQIEALQPGSSRIGRKAVALGPENTGTMTTTCTNSTPDYLPTSSDNSMAGASGKHESWEFDSGARDLSPEPYTLQKLIEAAGGSLTGNTTSLLELANKLHLAAIASLKEEVLDLTSRIQSIIHERDLLEKALNSMQLEKLKLMKENKDHLDLQAQRYEERLTELHSVIAELSKKIEHQRSQIIHEEDEDSQSADSQSHITLEDPKDDQKWQVVQDSTSNVINVSELQDEEGGEKTASTVSRGDVESSIVDVDASENPIDLESPARKEIGTSCHSLQLVALQEELTHLRAENGALHGQLGQQEAEINRMKMTLGSSSEEKERLRRKIRELQLKLQQQQQQAHGSPQHNLWTDVPQSLPAIIPCDYPATVTDDTPVCKVAEKVKLRKIETGERHVTGSEISILGVSNTKVAEHLVQDLHEESDMQEICHSLSYIGGSIAESKIREFEIESEKLHSKIEHLRAQNDVLNLTLEESKALGDKLSVLLGKYESNNTALNLAVAYSDQTIEGYDVLVALLESELGLLLANCRAAGIGRKKKSSEHGDAESVEVAALLKKANENRMAAENVARHLLARLERRERVVCGMLPASGVWEEEFLRGTSDGASSGRDFSKSEEYQLREAIMRLKEERTALRSTITELERLTSVHVDPLAREPVSSGEARQLDLETAVLIQELSAMREEKAELRAHLHLMEKEKLSLEMEVSSREAQEQACLAHIDHLRNEIEAIEREMSSSDAQYSENGSALYQAEPNVDVLQMIHREDHLKGRLQELLATLEKIAKSSEVRQMQSSDLISDLKRSNSALVQALEKAKKKHQVRYIKMKRLERQMLNMVERHATQVQLLKQRIALLEEENGSKELQRALNSAASETSL